MRRSSCIFIPLELEVLAQQRECFTDVLGRKHKLLVVSWSLLQLPPRVGEITNLGVANAYFVSGIFGLKAHVKSLVTSSKCTSSGTNSTLNDSQTRVKNSP